jgi:transposase
MYAGVDSHKDTLLAVAVIDDGPAVTVRQLPDEAAEFAPLAALLTEHGCLRVGIEGSSNYGWAAAMFLLEAGIAVVEVPPLWWPSSPAPTDTAAGQREDHDDQPDSAVQHQ